ACALVAQQEWEARAAVCSALDAQIGMAYARCQNAHQHLVCAGIVDRKFLDRGGRSWRARDRSACFGWHFAAPSQCAFLWWCSAVYRTSAHSTSGLVILAWVDSAPG